MAIPEGIRVLVVDDHPVLRAGLTALIGNQPDMQVVGEAESEEETLEKFAALQPDVTLMDIRLPTISGIELTARIRARWPNAKVIAFTSHWKEEDVYQALERGMWAYVRKGAPAAELMKAIRSVHSGRRYIPPEIGGQVAGHLAKEDLTEREHEVLRHMFEGRSNRQIATLLEISEHTVSVHARRIMSKLGASRRTEAIAAALKKGILIVE
jgi:DNA-binding NarL/FixJ family response regulator